MFTQSKFLQQVKDALLSSPWTRPNAIGGPLLWAPNRGLSHSRVVFALEEDEFAG